jgi:nucleotide-binding universal stress UspA family protein
LRAGLARRKPCAFSAGPAGEAVVARFMKRTDPMKRILVALDSSPRAPMVLAAADRLAALTGASMVVFRAVMVPPDMPRDLFAVTDLRLEDVLTRNARGDLERLTRDLPPERLEKIVAEFATPWDGICRAAREEAADLIVIGSHGYGGLDRVLGTTAGKVVNHADRNVLVVRAAL